jgi:hypothetical protein
MKGIDKGSLYIFSMATSGFGINRIFFNGFSVSSLSKKQSQWGGSIQKGGKNIFCSHFYFFGSKLGF